MLTERAYRCGVCRTLYTLAPPNPRWTARAGHVLRGVIGAACISLLAFGLAGPPWPHLALLALVLLGSRSHGLLAVALLAAGTLIAVLHAKGLRLLMRVDDAGRLGLSVVRHGAPIPGLGAGTLLVASDDLDRSIFRRSVIFLYQHSRSGTTGVIINQPLRGTSDQRLRNSSFKQNSSSVSASEGGAGLSPLHFLGGPVGMPGEGARQEIAILHTIPGVEGAIPVLTAPSFRPRLFYVNGGRLADVLTLAGGPHGKAANENAIHVYHGISTWGQGQLEGEIRAGAWAYGEALQEDLMRTDHDQLWGSLLGSDRLNWLA